MSGDAHREALLSSIAVRSTPLFGSDPRELPHTDDPAKALASALLLVDRYLELPGIGSAPDLANRAGASLFITC